MAIAINGSGTITGISAGGLPDDCITTADIATGAVTQAKRSEQLTLGTSQASTSGTSIDFTSIPSWVKRVTVMFNGVSTSGTSNWLVQLGSGSVTSSGYTSLGSNYTNAPVITQTTSAAGFLIIAGASTVFMTGTFRLHLLSGNTWVGDGLFIRSDVAISNTSGGSVTLSGTLDRVRITTVNGTDTFDAGSINILYE